MNFLINTITSWDEPPRARHQLANALAEENIVCFVCRNRTGNFGIEVTRESVNLTVITPYWPFDYRIRYRTPFLNEMYQNWLFKALLSFKPALHDGITINFDHTAIRLFKYFAKVVYYCNDDHVGNGKFNPLIINKYHSYCETKVIKRSRMCIGTSRFLKEKLSKLNGNSFLIPLGAPDVKNASRSNVKPRSGTIKVGLVGFIDSQKVPVEVINNLTEHHNIRVTVIGPCTEEFRTKIRHKERVTFKCSMVGEDLYREISDFDVAIAPYVVANCNRGVSPNKLWLYLAMGKPVVVSNLPNVDDLNLPVGVIYKADSVNDFVVLVVRAFRENNDDVTQQRIDIAKANTWNKKAEELSVLISRYL